MELVSCSLYPCVNIPASYHSYSHLCFICYQLVAWILKLSRYAYKKRAFDMKNIFVSNRLVLTKYIPSIYIPRSCYMACNIYDHWCMPKGHAPVVSLSKSHSEEWLGPLLRNVSLRSAFPSSVPRKRTRIRPRNSLLSLDCFSVLSGVWPRNKQKHTQLFTFIVLRSSRRYIK